MRLNCNELHLEQRGGVCLLCADVPRISALRLMETLGGDKRYTLEIKEERRRRSLDANAYYWTLCGQLAKHYGLAPEEIYRQQIRHLGGVYDVVNVQEAAADRLVKTWPRQGLGWMAETTESKLPGCVDVILWYGSSTYDTRQMSQLIDRAVEDCKEVGIETLTPDKLDLLKDGWK